VQIFHFEKIARHDAVDRARNAHEGIYAIASTVVFWQAAAPSCYSSASSTPASG
jgi:hypothetical protein